MGVCIVRVRVVSVNVNSIGVHVCGFTQVCGVVVGTSHHGNNNVLPPVIDRQAAKERVSSTYGHRAILALTSIAIVQSCA